ncbi:MAG: host attachment protein [Patescibacteria group bacterium]|nr:host attachment family protein [Patescibacteria group bacterium]
MIISEHYLGYPKKTLIVVTNNELAKIYTAFEREVEELRVIEMETEKPEARASGVPNAAPPDLDEQKKHIRVELYQELSDLLKSYLKKGYEEIILCAPEALKNEIVDAMHTDVMNAVGETVPKNLASLPLDQIIRILQESRI